MATTYSGSALLGPPGAFPVGLSGCAGRDVLEFLAVKHGESEADLSGRKGSVTALLTDRGVAQAHALALELRRSAVDVRVVLASPVRRALQTGTIILRDLGCPGLVAPGFQQLHLGYAEGLPLPEYRELMARLGYVGRTPGGDSRQAVEDRVRGELEELRVCRRQGVLAVVHNSTLRAMHRICSGASIDDVLTRKFAACEVYAFCYEG